MVWLLVDNDSGLSNHPFSTWLLRVRMDTLMIVESISMIVERKPEVSPFCMGELGNGINFFHEFLIALVLPSPKRLQRY